MKNAFTQKPDITKWVNDLKISERSKRNGALGAAALNMKNGGKNETKGEITMVLGKSKTGKKGGCMSASPAAALNSCFGMGQNSGNVSQNGED